jgi:hypothetical protein
VDEVFIDGNGIPIEESPSFGIDGQVKGVYLVYTSGENKWRFALNEYKIALDIGNDGGIEEEFVNEITSENEPSSSILTNPSDSEARFDWSNITSISGVGNVELIESITASSQATVDFDTGIDSDHSFYIIALLSVLPANDSVGLRARFSPDGGTTIRTANYKYACIDVNSNGGTFRNATGSSSINISPQSDVGGESGEGIEGTVTLLRPSANFESKMNLDIVSHNSGFDVSAWRGMGMHTTTESINWIRFFFDSGNIAEGIFELYGIG